MAELKPPPVQSGGQTGVGIPGLNLITIAAARCWIVLALLALAAGLVWRQSGFAPPLLSLLDAIGLALWCTALFLEPAWERLQSMQARHFHMSPAIWVRQYAIAAVVAGCGVPLAFAALGTLLAYDTRVTVARILTLERVNIAVDAGTFCLAILLLAGPSLICLSLAILTAGRAWFGRTAGTVIWTAGLLLLNSGPLWNGNQRFGLTLGLLADKLRGRMNLVNFDPTQGMYLSDLVIEALVLPLAALGVCIVLLAWTSMRPRPRRASQRPHVGWLAAATALGVVSLAAGLGVAHWSSDPSATTPGSWAGLIYLGTTTLIVAAVLFSWTGGDVTVAPGNAQLAWILALVPAWGVYTLPNIYAGSVTHREVLALLAVVLLVCAMFSVVILAIARSVAVGQAGGQGAYLVVLALAAVPVDPEYGSVATFLSRALYQAVAQPEYRTLALPMAIVMLLIVGFSLWQLGKQPVRRHPGPASGQK